MSIFEQFLVSVTPWSREDLFEAAEILRNHVRLAGGDEDDLITIHKNFSETLNRFADDNSCVHIVRFAKYFVNTISTFGKQPQQASHDL